MTVKQIKYILQTKGITSYENIALDDGTPFGIGMIGLYGDGNILTNGSTVTFTFDLNKELLYVKVHGREQDIIAFSSICAFYDKRHSSYNYY